MIARQYRFAIDGKGSYSQVVGVVVVDVEVVKKKKLKSEGHHIYQLR